MPENEKAETEWLDCIPWDGRESSLPTGGQIFGVWPEKLVYRWEIADGESETGSRLVKPSEFTADMRDSIVGAQINETLYKRMQVTYGPRFCEISQSTGEGNITREAWREKYGTDGLVLWAIRRMRYPREATIIGGTQGITTPNQSVTNRPQSEYVQIGGAGGITTTAPQARSLGNYKPLGKY